MEMNRNIISKDKALFFKFLSISVIATIIDVSLLYILTEYTILTYFYSAPIAYLSSTLPNFLLNKIFNFKNKSKKVFKQYLTFISISIVGLIFNQIIIMALVESFSIYYLYAKGVAIIIVFFWNFFSNKNVTFKVFQ
jgi:putative flippase GtrA